MYAAEEAVFADATIVVTSLGQLPQDLRLLIFERTDPCDLVEPYRASLLLPAAWKALAVTDRATHVDMKLIHTKWCTKEVILPALARTQLGKSQRLTHLSMHAFPSDWFPLNLEDAGGNQFRRTHDSALYILEEMLSDVQTVKQRPQSTVVPELINEVRTFPPLEMEEVD